MQILKSTDSVLPIFPGPLSLPLKLIPGSVHSRILAISLNKIFARELEEDELNFLHDRSVTLEVRDLGLTYRFTLYGNKLKEDTTEDESDLTIRGSLYDFILLVGRQVDPDTLVFKRRLVMEGDTELGLALKNYIDAIDIDSSRALSIIESLSRKTLPLYKYLFS